MLKEFVCILFIIILFKCQDNLFAQNVKYENGVKVIENGKEGLWSKNPQVKLEYQGKFGNHSETDESSFLTLPEDITFDQQGNIYILDGGEQKIKKYDRNGKHLLTFGRKGRGPGEMIMPTVIDISSKGNVYVIDDALMRINIYSTEGKSIGAIKMKTGIIRFSTLNDETVIIENRELDGNGAAKPLFYQLDKNGKILKEFGEGPYPKGKRTNSGSAWNRINFTTDKKGNIYAGFKYKNRINKYDKEGKLVLQIKTPHKDNNGEIFGIAIDSKERIWVLSQVKENPIPPHRFDPKKEIYVIVNKAEGKKIVRPAGVKIETKCDLYSLELYDKDGSFLCKYPLTNWIANNEILKISNNKIYVLENIKEGTFHVYKISDL
jgi:DNA-binding beta-propeller fold protein YncE